MWTLVLVEGRNMDFFPTKNMLGLHWNHGELEIQLSEAERCGEDLRD